MLEKYNKWILLCIVIFGFALRYYGASNCCVIWDERHHDFPPAREISFNLKHLNLPLIDTAVECSPMAGKYLIKAGWDIFGDTLLGARIPFVIIGTANILLIYFLAKMALGNLGALLAAFFIAADQFNLTTSLTADTTNPVVIFITIISLWLFYNALWKSDKKMLFVNGAVIGIGFWFREEMPFLIPMYLIFLSVCPKLRPWLKNRDLWVSFVISLLIALPLVYLNLLPIAHRFGYIHHESVFGPSLNALGLYLGELILWIIRPFTKFFDYVASSVDPEYDMVNFALGILVLFSAIKSIRSKEPFIRLLVVSFLLNFVFFSFIRRNNVIQSVWSLGSLDWGSISIVPGFILAAHTLETLNMKRRRLGLLICTVLVLFMSLRALDIAMYPLNSYFPRREYLLKNNYFIYQADDTLRRGNSLWAKEMYKKVYQVADKTPECKKAAAFGLVRILIGEGRYNESREYLDYVLLQNNTNREALGLKSGLQNKYLGVINGQI